jgi:uncharacterized protein YegL
MTDYPEEQVKEGSFTEGQLIMPFYLIIDCSGSMHGDLPTLQRDLQALVGEIASDGVACDTTMLSIITFGSGARTLVALSDPGSITVPTLSDMGGTDFGAALKEYDRAFKADYARLKSEGSKVFRPCVFFLTDGYAGDNWEETFNRLLSWDPRSRTGNQMYPYIVAYGYRDAQEETMKKLAYPNFGEKLGKWFLSRTNNVSELLKSMLGTIGQTIVTSGLSVGAGRPQLNLPQAVSTPGTLAGEPDILP